VEAGATVEDGVTEADGAIGVAFVATGAVFAAGLPACFPAAGSRVAVSRVSILAR
jgi:hypothetical protein